MIGLVSKHKKGPAVNQLGLFLCVGTIQTLTPADGV